MWNIVRAMLARLTVDDIELVNNKVTQLRNIFSDVKFRKVGFYWVKSTS